MRKALSLACLILSGAASSAVEAAVAKTERRATVRAADARAASDVAMAERLLALELRMRTVLRLRGLPVPPTYGTNLIIDNPDPVGHGPNPSSGPGDTVGGSGRWKLTDQTTAGNGTDEPPLGGSAPTSTPPRKGGSGGSGGSGSGDSGGGQDGG
jgi:uncharacterized membrane protein YgcG